MSASARRIASALERRGLAAPARLLADAHRPLGPLLGDLGIAVGPLVTAVGGRRASSVVELFERPDALDRVVAAIDEVGDRDADAG